MQLVLTTIKKNPKLFFWLSILIVFIITRWYYKSRSCYKFTQKREGFAMVRVGDNSYKIHEDLTDPIKAAETMDRLNTVAKKLIDEMYKKYIDDPNGMNLIKDQYKKTVSNGIKDMKKNFITANMEENIPARSGGDTSFVIDKGDVFAMCLRDPKNGNQLDPKFNDLTFVLLHELSHLGFRGWSHPMGFWTMFKFVLQEAVDFGLYEKTDYKKRGSDYCGIVITYSPLFDSKLVDYHK